MKPTFREQLSRKILILDGAMGTMLQQANLTADDFGGEAYDGCNELLNLTRPDVIRSIHEKYLAAGADIVETNTFGAASIVLAEYDVPEKDLEINIAAARLAREAVDAYSTEEWPRFVAGAMGPTTKTLALTGGVTFEELVEAYYRQAKGLILGGSDVLLLETSQDTLNVKAGGIGIRKAFEELGQELPVMLSGTIEPMGTTLAGQNIEAFYISLEHLQPVSIGLNCATGPEFMRDHLRTLSGIAQCAVSCYPNAGLPDENGHYHETPQGLASKMRAFADQGWINVAGGCCGTTPDHIQAMAEALKDCKPRSAAVEPLSAVSGIEVVYVEDDNRPLLVGERTNVIGSKKFREMIAAGHYEEASDIARAQVKRGAHVIDICLADPDRDEYEDMEKFLQFIVKKVKAPLMIDSTDAKVMELGLRYSQGKAILNSINLEDGLERFEEVVPLIHKFGASVVVGTIEEAGMAITREKKLEVAQRSYDILVNQYGIKPQDIIFDPLVFPVGTGDEQYIGSAKETVEGIRLIKQVMPACKTILGVSNVSFGLPPAGREVLNAVFLYHTTLAGLDYAIVNTEKLERYASIPEDERKLAEALLFETNDETLAAFTEFYRQKKKEVSVEVSSLTLEERLARYVVEGSKDGLVEDLKLALEKYTPLEIINGPLMAGMEEVGRLFNGNQLIVAEVLQSAEVMKASVSFLEPFMEKSDAAAKGKILLATVKGDVHDIGKNLVEIILSNNGYNVVNLGIKVPPEQLIAACREEKPDAIGLSGLLVKSAQQMVITAQDLRDAGIDIPMMVGGAALTRKFTSNRIAPEYRGIVLYAKDAMDGLDLVNRLQNPEERDRLVEEQQHLLEAVATAQPVIEEKKAPLPARSAVSRTVPIHLPPDCERHVLRQYPLSHLQPYLNLRMLLGKHLGVRGNVDRLIEAGDEKVLELYGIVEELLNEAKQKGTITTHGVYQFFPAQSDGNDILVYDPKDHSKLLERFSFPRQLEEPHLCLSDFLRPVESKEMDYVGFLTVTAGGGIREKSTELKERGDYLRSHVLQSLALELAEAFAERIHHVMRDVWGIPDPVEMTMLERFGARYQGIRVSFGYPACPNLEDQAQLFRLLRPEDIGVQLTEGFMMEPEASVSAMVFAHPEARYFNAGPSIFEV
ncbi:methionine synthase [Brevibacillus sp. HB1.4B]|uniref:methionine synthase n=1 Tax=Brevibacillus sp. HB1.4B TaxID=2738845 RepID=UPI0003692FDF|nr:methionine synthase [Brevibacillus sp. HB1.4B]ATF12756.1 methionine synthase [Brevibacillus brevis X23]NRS20385.1 methionine synthase [Brevibacillus sp. HB1.4B]